MRTDNFKGTMTVLLRFIKTFIEKFSVI